jgi:hypothetical protein
METRLRFYPLRSHTKLANHPQAFLLALVSTSRWRYVLRRSAYEPGGCLMYGEKDSYDP